MRARYIHSVVLALSMTLHAQVQDAQRALDHAVRTTPAVAVVLDARTGRMLAAAHLNEASRTAPGSVLKPFFLIQGLRRELIDPRTTVLCHRQLHIAGRNVDCTHPQNEIAFDAEQALAYSCNSYFAELAKRFTPDDEATALTNYGVPRSSVLRMPADTQQSQLFILGLEGVSVTPMQLAEAYRKLADDFVNLPPESRMQTVLQGLEDSVTYGMGHNAYVTGLPIAGKTGTASDPGLPWTHGWFAGFAPAKSPKAVVVVYLPRGNGADAAHLAQVFFTEYKGALLP